MKKISLTVQALVAALAACAVGSAAMADNLLGLYAGVGVGESQIRSDDPAYGYPAYYNDYQTAWKGFIGIRPIPMLGLEASYIDFGQPGNYNYYSDVNYYGTDSHPTAPALFAVGYLPIPIPYFDLFAKAGAARLRTNVNVVSCSAPNPATCVNGYDVSISRQAITDTKFAYGGGVQAKLPFVGLSFRAEYERIASGYGDPDALMVSAIWTF